MPDTMNLSIIIVNFNTEVLLRRCLESVYRTLTGSGLHWEVIVVDNASGDGSVQMVHETFPTTVVIQNKANVGFGKANNQGLTLARGEYILLLNSDTIAQDGAIKKLYGFVHRKPNTFAGAKLFNQDGSTQPSCGPFFTLPVVITSLYFQGDRIGLTRYSPNSIRRVDWVSGACLIAPRKLFLVNLFDESIFMYMDEIDLLYRARKKGYHTYFFPGAKFLHIGAASSGNKTTPVLNIYKGLLVFYTRHYPRWKIIVLRILLKIKAMVAWGIGVLTGNTSLRITYAEAYRLV